MFVVMKEVVYYLEAMIHLFRGTGVRWHAKEAFVSLCERSICVVNCIGRTDQYDDAKHTPKGSSKLVYYELCLSTVGWPSNQCMKRNWYCFHLFSQKGASPLLNPCYAQLEVLKSSVGGGEGGGAPSVSKKKKRVFAPMNNFRTLSCA